MLHTDARAQQWQPSFPPMMDNPVDSADFTLSTGQGRVYMYDWLLCAKPQAQRLAYAQHVNGEHCLAAEGRISIADCCTSGCYEHADGVLMGRACYICLQETVRRMSELLAAAAGDVNSQAAMDLKALAPSSSRIVMLSFASLPLPAWCPARCIKLTICSSSQPNCTPRQCEPPKMSNAHGYWRHAT